MLCLPPSPSPSPTAQVPEDQAELLKTLVAEVKDVKAELIYTRIALDKSAGTVFLLLLMIHLMVV